MRKIKLSKNLNHTWLIDIDGTILFHNGYKTKKGDLLLPGVKKFFKNIPKQDKVILLTSRKKKKLKMTLLILKKNKIRFNKVITDLPFGERVLINDIKPKKKLKTAISINIKRNSGLQKYVIS